MREFQENKHSLLRGVTILFVEDSDILRRNSPLPLLAQGATVITAENGLEAIRIIQERGVGGHPPFDLIITDYGMPLMDGEQLLQALTEDEATKEIPVIFMSAVLKEGEEQRFREKPQVKSVLEKSAQSQKLLEAVQEAIK